eukprot:10992020-Lingulodinium_polyedra.AAC.1
MERDKRGEVTALRLPHPWGQGPLSGRALAGGRRRLRLRHCWQVPVAPAVSKRPGPAQVHLFGAGGACCRLREAVPCVRMRR